jgi:hypothetical protein
MYAGAGCCWLHFWHPTDANRLYVVDGSPNQRAFLTAWDVSSGQSVGEAGAEIPYMAPDGIHQIWHTGSNVVMRDSRDGSVQTLFTGGTIPSVSPDGTKFMWITRSGESVPGQDGPPTTVWMSDLDGENAGMVLSDRGISAQWLDSNRLLIGKSGEGRTRNLSVFNLSDGRSFDLGTWTNMRGASVAPGGGHVIFYLSFQEDPADNGVYTIETLPGVAAQQLPWFGDYRWRDSDSLYYIPFDPATSIHQLMYYDLRQGISTPLTDPATTPFSIMNGDWEVSADGRRIVFHDALTQALTLLEMN